MDNIGLIALQSIYGGAIVFAVIGLLYAILKVLKLADAIYNETEKWKDREKILQLLRSIKIKLLRMTRKYLRKLKHVPRSQQPLKSGFMVFIYVLASLPFTIFYAAPLLAMVFNPEKVTFTLFVMAIAVSSMSITYARALLMAAHRQYLSLK